MMEATLQARLRDMRNVDVRTVDITGLKDIRDVQIDQSLPASEKIQSYIEQIGNPYCFKHGKYIVKVTHTENGATLNEQLEAFLSLMV